MAAPEQNNSRDLQSVDLLWISSSPTDLILERYGTSTKGLPEKIASERLQEYGANETARKKKRTVVYHFLSKFFNPLVVVLAIIGVFSLFFGESVSALIVFLLIMVSVLMSFVQEYRSDREVEKLREMVRTSVTVFRDGSPKEVNINDIAPGDIVDLFAGDIVPADLRVISCKDLFVNQATFTGESFPVEKFSAPAKPESQSIFGFSNMAFMGSSVESGTGLGVVVRTGTKTKLGEISKRLAAATVETAFDRGIKDFTWLMIKTMIVMVIFIFAVNALLKGNLVEAFLFSLAVAVGITPEMLPVLVTINLSNGAIVMSKKQVIVKRLPTIQNLGAMDVLCTDKTGTLTMNEVVLEKYCDVRGREDNDVLRYAYLNSFYQTGLRSLLDKTILKHEEIEHASCRKVDEIPFDFSRRVMSVIVEQDDKHVIVTKGAPEEVFRCCTKYELDGKVHKMRKFLPIGLSAERKKLNMQGFRLLAVAYREFKKKKDVYSKDDEKGLILKGYLAFFDPPKPTAKTTLKSLGQLGIEVKVVTGDNGLVTKKIASDVGLFVRGVLIGDQIDKMNDAELEAASEKTTIFARLTPLQKERVIRALRRGGHIVGFLGDGINDAPALKAADVGISVNNAVDIAKESADIILLRKSLGVLKDGVIEGRRTFSNITKYVKMGSSSNFGNMLSMTGASLVLPFLPMAPLQILLNNFLYDLSQTAIPTDTVDEIYIKKPLPWNVDYIKRFMVIMGPISSIFDFITFGILLFVFHAQETVFHTCWFLESLCTQTFIIHVIRTGKVPFIESRASTALIATSLLIVTAGFVVVFAPPLADAFHFAQPPAEFFPVLAVIIISYLFLAQKVKEWLIRKYGHG